MSRWSGATKAPKVTRRPCKFGCGRHVDEFRTEWGQPVSLDTQPPPVTYDLAESQYRHRIYEYRGPYIGWCHKFSPERGWRELRLAHECAEQHQKQHQNKKERKR